MARKTWDARLLNHHHSSAILLLLLLLVAGCEGIVVSTQPITLDEGKIQVHYESSCDTIVMINVGTGMSVTDYEYTGKSIVRSSSAVAIIMDDNPGKLQKQDGEKYANLVNAILNGIVDLVPSCSKPAERYLIGGHSGGGQGAVEALRINKLQNTPAGFIGLAPYKITPKLSIAIPSLNIDFSRKSCAVEPTKAGLAAYSQSDENHRVFFQMHTQNWNSLAGGPHCSFSDSGCFSMCTGGEMNEWMHDFVGETVNLFVQAIISNNFNADQFHINTGNYDVELFVNSNTPELSSRFNNLSILRPLAILVVVSVVVNWLT